MSKVSIIVPVYNTQDYLEQCLNSVKNQTQKEIEVIIVDDCTPDNSMVIAEQFVNEDSRFRILKHHHNKKLGAARNTGMKDARSKYIIFLDSDDMLPRNAVELLLDKIEKTDAEMVFGKMFWVDEKEDGNQKNQSPVTYINDKIDFYKTKGFDNLRNINNSFWFIGSVCNRIYKKEFLEANKIVFDEGVYWEDVYFSIQTWYMATKIYAIEDAVYWRIARTNENNQSITQNYDMKKYTDRDILMKETYDFFEKQNKSDNMIAKNMLNRIYTTTQKIVPLANEEIKQQVSEWYKQHKKITETYFDKFK